MDTASDLIHQSDSVGSSWFINLFLGFLLLLPGAALALESRFEPALRTYELSLTDARGVLPLQTEARPVGTANYERLLANETFGQSVQYTVALVFWRVAVVMIIPPLIGIIAGSQGTFDRLLSRLILSAVGVFISPVVLSMLWVLFWMPVWGTQPAPESLRIPELSLRTIDGARLSVLLLDSLFTLGIGVAVGVTAYMAAMRGRQLGRPTGSAVNGVWLISGLWALLSVSESFIIPFVTTNGGPVLATQTIGLEIYREAFLYLRLNAAAPASVLVMAFAAAVVVLIWGLLSRHNLRLTFTASPKATLLGGMSIISFPLLLITLAALGGLFAWGVWLLTEGGSLTTLLNQITEGFEAYFAAVRVPWQAIWLVQIPALYLAGMAFGFFRPLGPVLNNLLFLLALIIVFIPVDALLLQLFLDAAQQKIVNTHEALQIPWVVSGFALIVFKMFFAGAHERYNQRQDEGADSTAAFLQVVFIPSLFVAAAVGVVLSFASAQSITWPMIVINNRELFSPLQLLVMSYASANMSQQQLIIQILKFVVVNVVVFLPLFFVLHVFVLDRLAIIGGPVALRKPVEAETLELISESVNASPIVYTR